MARLLTQILVAAGLVCGGLLLAGVLLRSERPQRLRAGSEEEDDDTRVNARNSGMIH